MTRKMKLSLIKKVIINTPSIKRYLTNSYRQHENKLYFKTIAPDGKLWTRNMKKFIFPQELFVSNTTSPQDITLVVVKSGICRMSKKKEEEFYARHLVFQAFDGRDEA